jgi:hypothetical protein
MREEMAEGMKKLATLITAAEGFEAAQVLVVEAEAKQREWETAARKLYAACIDARQFIRNGIEFGYIQLPDNDTPDTAKQTLPSLDEIIDQHWPLITKGNLFVSVTA